MTAHELELYKKMYEEKPKYRIQAQFNEEYDKLLAEGKTS